MPQIEICFQIFVPSLFVNLLKTIVFFMGQPLVLVRSIMNKRLLLHRRPWVDERCLRQKKDKRRGGLRPFSCQNGKAQRTFSAWAVLPVTRQDSQEYRSV